MTLVALATLFTPRKGQSAIYQPIDQLFEGDDPTIWFPVTLAFDPGTASTVRFGGFVENLSTNEETGVRFAFAWRRTNEVWEEVVTFPAGEAYYMGVRLPAADPVLGPAPVPLDLRADLAYVPGSCRFCVEGLGGCDNFRLVGTFTLQSAIEPELGISRASATTVRLAWPTNFPGFVLESATLPIPVWTEITNVVSVSGADYSVTLDTVDRQRIFRLRKS